MRDQDQDRDIKAEDELIARFENALWASLPYSAWDVQTQRGRCRCCHAKVVVVTLHANGQPMLSNEDGEVESMKCEISWDAIQENKDDLPDWCKKCLQPAFRSVVENTGKIINDAKDFDDNNDDNNDDGDDDENDDENDK